MTEQTQAAPPLITPGLVLLRLADGDRHDAARQLAALLAEEGRVTDLEGFLADVRAREEQMPTGLPGGIGVPHARSAHVTVPTLAFGRSSSGIDFGAEDGPATLVFLIAAPEGGGSEHLEILGKLARRLVKKAFKQALAEAPDRETVVRTVSEAVA